MRATEKRLARLEGAEPDVTEVVVSVPPDWPEERRADEATALALSAGAKPPFRFVYVIEAFGEGSAVGAELISMKGGRVHAGH